ncbi:uncharacterized protein LOC117282712 [Cryptotermes secundus]|uniref:uncharacterized protein LOC117282712 n=1 Tax=Cryptotermes secundus TaxID=105785 RepID=UPI001454C393|nr:uncharacterized protein LOC117282712 [Cryptotermes secundus]
MAIINSILENSVCSECKYGPLKIKEDVQCHRGWASKLVLSCTSYGLNENYFTSLTSENGQYQVNRRSVFAPRCIGKGHAAGEIFSAIVDLPPPVANFELYNKIVNDTVCKGAEDSMKRASAECKVVNDGEGDIAVTADGTWMQRGHVSKIQNVNESLNGVIRQGCPKTGFASTFTVETAVEAAVA